GAMAVAPVQARHLGGSPRTSTWWSSPSANSGSGAGTTEAGRGAGSDTVEKAGPAAEPEFADVDDLMEALRASVERAGSSKANGWEGHHVR
ncbi:hypothetical protein ACFXPJ_36685, partial [Streptomyces goshikiensis]